MRSRLASLALLTAIALSAATAFGTAPGDAHASRRATHRPTRCAPRHARTLARRGSSVLFLQTAGPSDGKYGAPHSLLGCSRAFQRPLRLFEFEDGDEPSEVRASFDGPYAVFYLGWSYSTCSFYISAGAEDCETSLFESVDLRNGHTLAALPGVREGGPALPSALVVTRNGWIAWVSRTAASTPLRARDSTGTRTLDPGPIDAGSLSVGGAAVSWTDGGVAHSATLG